MKSIIATVAALSLALPIFASPIQPEVTKRDPAACPPTLPTQAITYDDQDPRVTYSAGWSHLQNQGYNLYNKTISYTNLNNAEVFFPSPVPTGRNYTYGVTIWSTKKYDRGVFNVYCGQKLIGSGNEYYNGAETNTQIVFHNTAAVCAGGEPLVVKNDRGANYIAVDALKVEWSAL